MKARPAALLAVFLLVPLTTVPAGASGPAIQNPSTELVYDNTVTLQTDATSGTVTLYAPATSGSSCFTQVLSIPASYDGQVPGVELDRAGTWKLEHRNGGATTATSFQVVPQALRILATAIPATGGSYDYDIQVAHESTKVPYAYVDAYFGSALVRHLQSDANGQVNLHAAQLPYAGTYELVAYKDLGTPPFAYSNPFVDQAAPPCDGTYNAPELYQAGAEVGSGFSSVAKDTVPFNVQVTDGAIQVRHIPSSSTLRIETPYGSPVTPSNVQLWVDGQTVLPITVGLSLTVTQGQVVLSGSWDSPSDIVVTLVADSNGDGVPEYTGTSQIQVRHDLPMRIVPVHPDGTVESDPRLSYRVPPPNADGTPGQQVLRFKVLDLDNHEGQPPAIQGVSITGDLLPGASVAYDAANGYWIATATPRNSDSDYRITIPWTNVGRVTFTIDMPRDGGAKTTAIDADLVVSKRSFVTVDVQRFNAAAITHANCSPVPSCAYEHVTDAHVSLVWADTGEPLLDPAGNPYEYYPGRAPGACDCYEYQGVYRFQNIAANRSGLAVAIAKINVPGEQGTFQYSYQPLPVAPQPVYTPTVNPTRSLAGAFTRYALTSAGLTATTLDQYEVHLLDADGHDVIDPNNFTTLGPQVFFSAALPEGSYTLTVQDRLDPFAAPPMWGKKGTLVPGTLRIVPADVRFTHTDVPLHASTVGNLQQARAETYLLGGSLGDVQQIRVDAFGPDGQRTPGTIHLEGFELEAGAAHAFALLAYSDKNQPTTVGAPRLYAPADPQLTWMCQSPEDPAPNEADCGSYYFSELPSPIFGMVLDLPYNAQSQLIYVFGTGLGDVRVSFLPAGSALNTRQPTHSTIHIVPPSLEATTIATKYGTTPDLVVGTSNLVALKGWDPTGYNSLEGASVDLARHLYGPSQVPGGVLHYADGPYGTTLLSIVPDASGPLSGFVLHGVAAVDTGLRLGAIDASQATFNTTGVQVFVDIPSRVDEASPVPIRVGTSTDPFPQGVVVRTFGNEVALVSGSGTLLAPFVDDDQEFPVEIRIPGLLPVVRTLHVDDVADQVRNLQVSGMVPSIKEGQSFTVVVKDGRQPLGGVSIQLLATNTTTDARGEATIQAPLVTRTTDVFVTLSRANYTTLQFPVQVIDAGLPQLVLETPRSMEGGKSYTITVKAVNERGQPVIVPASTRSSIEAQWATLRFDGLAGASWMYEAPRLAEDVRIYAFARADGYESAMAIITIQGAN